MDIKQEPEDVVGDRPTEKSKPLTETTTKLQEAKMENANNLNECDADVVIPSVSESAVTEDVSNNELEEVKNVFDTLKDRIDSLKTDLEEFMSAPILNNQTSSTTEPMNCHELAVSLNNDLNFVVDSVTSSIFPLDILKNNVKNSALNQLASYGSSESDNASDSDIDGVDCPIISTDGHSNFRNKDEHPLYDTDDSSTVSDTDSDESVAVVGESKQIKSPNSRRAIDEDKLIRTKGDLRLCDLPPIENLQISVPEQECVELGAVMSIVEELVVVQALPNMPPLDIDSVLFLSKGTETLGKIFDVFGPVNKPCYAVRFNSKDDIEAKGITIGIQVYCAPRTEHTSYVLVSDLMKLKGSDASWKEDTELPENLVEFSDDEDEKRARSKRKSSARGIDETSGTSDFEKRKNQRNLQLNAHFSKQQKTTARPVPQNYAPRWPPQNRPRHHWYNNPAPGPSYNNPPPPPPNFYANPPFYPDPFFFRPPVFQPPNNLPPYGFPTQYATAPPPIGTHPPMEFPPDLPAPPLFPRRSSQPTSQSIPGPPFPPPPDF